MNRLFVLLFLLLLGAQPGNSAAQDTPDQLLDDLEEAIGSGDVDVIVGIAGRRLDVSIFGEGKSYSRAQADFVLEEFFTAHKATSFRFTASSKTDNGRFVEGLYYSSTSRKPFQIYIRLQRRGQSWELREFMVRRPRT